MRDEGDMLMKTIQMTIDEPLLDEVDRTVQYLNTTRSAFVRDALKMALRRHQILEMEKAHAAGYRRQPVQPGEFDLWLEEQSWGDA
jgi:metal-responsive CopG/Arc/MetJ family transcriptional regulator